MQSGSSGAMNVVATLGTDGRVYNLNETAPTPQVKLNNYKIRTEPINPQGSNQKAAGELSKLLLQCARDNDLPGVQKLLSRGAPFTSDWLGMCPLHFAVVNNNYEMCEVLLTGGINKDIRTKVDRTPLHLAAYYGCDRIAQLLLSKGCQVDPRDMLRMTPLHWAVDKRQKTIVRLLLKYNADVSVMNKYQRTPIAFAVMSEQADILEELQAAKTLQCARKSREKLESEMKDAVNSIADIKFEIPDEPETPDLSERLFTPDLTALLLKNSLPNFDFKQHHKGTNGRNVKKSSLDLLNGIAKLNHDEDASNNLLNSALQNGRQLVLSEGGKMLLKQTKQQLMQNNNNNNNNNNKPLSNKNVSQIANINNNNNNNNTNTNNNKVNSKEIQRLMAIEKDYTTPVLPTDITMMTDEPKSPNAVAYSNVQSMSSDEDVKELVCSVTPAKAELPNDANNKELSDTHNVSIISFSEFKKRYYNMKRKAMPNQTNTSAAATSNNNMEKKKLVVTFDSAEQLPNLASMPSSGTSSGTSSNSNQNISAVRTYNNINFGKKRAGIIRIRTHEIAENNAKIGKFSIPVSKAPQVETVTMPAHSNNGHFPLRIKTITRKSTMSPGSIATAVASNGMGRQFNKINLRDMQNQQKKSALQYQQGGVLQFHPRPQLLLPASHANTQTPTLDAMAQAAAVAASLKSTSTSITVQTRKPGSANMQTNCQLSTATTTKMSQEKSTTVVPLLSLTEVCRQLSEMRRQNEELKRRVDIIQREKYDLSQRLEQLEVLFMDSRTEFES